MLIESLQNNIIKNVKSLKSKKERDKLNLFIVEGLRFTDDIPSDWNIEEYIVSQSFANRYPEKLDKLNLKSKVYTIIDKIFLDISDTKTPQGILAVCKKKVYTISDMINNKSPFLLIVNELQDPGNLGTIIRVADAAGVTGILLSKATVDLYNNKVLRATMGSIFHVPIINNLDIKETILELKKEGLLIISTHLKGKQTPYSIDLKKPVAIIVGNEANGISNDIVNETDILVKLPMVGKLDSLNVSMASGIFLYEVVRQRLEIVYEI